LQDNGSWGGPSRTDNPAGILNRDWGRVLGFDGFHCQVPPDDPSTVYAEGQYGRLYRLDLRRRVSTPIRPPSRGETVRYNWSAPLLLSAHDSRTLYFGGNVLFKSTDRGSNWRRLTSDLTRGKQGISYRSTGHTLTALAESPLESGVMYAGSDDGKVYGTRDDWKKATDLSDRLADLPGDRWITRLECSPHKVSTVFLSVSRHRNDDRAAYLYRSDDYGQTWKSIVSNLPAGGPVHVIRADARNRDLLYVGTEMGLYVSLDGGGSWQRLGEGMPAVPVHDVVVHPKARELVVATHGRGIYILDALPLQELTAKVFEGRAHLFEVRDSALRKSRAEQAAPPRTYAGSNPPYGAVIHYWLKEKGRATLEVRGTDGKVVATLPVAAEAGLHRAVWDLRQAAGKAVVPVKPGEYTARLTIEGKTEERKFRVTEAR
jgi:hypothetical protein